MRPARLRDRLLAVIVLAAVLPSAAIARSPAATVRAGHLRVQVLTPTLVRLEYAADDRFTDAPTLTAVRARLPVPAYTAAVRQGTLTLTTAALTLRYRVAGGPPSPATLTLTIGRGRRAGVAHPAAGSGPGNLGGWTRALDNEAGPVPLHDGILATSGWYVLDDTQTVLPTPTGFAPRPAHTGPYQDWYVFAYGHDYAAGLADLRALTGPAPLLPRSAFGVWFSRYWPYSESGYHGLLADFRAHAVPLDTLSIDTDFKREANAAGSAAAAVVAGAPGKPYAWNGWEWDPALFPDPQRFIDWAHAQGLSLAINIHPSIDSTDPRYPATVAGHGPLSPASGQCTILQADPLGTCHTFDWADPRQLAAFFSLEQPFTQQGIDVLWLDWCCENVQPVTPGLTPDTWINAQQAAQNRARGDRWPAFSRIGGAYSASAADGPDGDRTLLNLGDGALAEHRSTIQFTGDTCASWPMLAFEAALSPSEGNIGLPYVSDDIGSYNGPAGGLPCGTSDMLGPAAAASHHLPDDLYARWVEFGTFQPLDRLHSNHGDRLPWQYAPAADAAAASFLRLREALGPTTYTLARRAHDTGLPITGGLYLQWPGQPGAYDHPSEYTYGPDVVVAPVTSPGDPAPARAWVPPGTWFDLFTGRRFTGPATVTLSVPLSRMPVLVRAGSILVTQPAAPDTAPGPSPRLTLSVFPGGRGGFSLYDDAGLGFGYERGAFTRTPITHRGDAVTIGRPSGRPSILPRSRRWLVHLIGVPRPRSVGIGGGSRRFAYDAATRTVTLDTGPLPTRRAVTITLRG